MEDAIDFWNVHQYLHGDFIKLKDGTSPVERKEVGFIPARRCPICGNMHKVKFKYRNKDILVCPRAETEKVMIFNENEAADLRADLESKLRITKV